MLVRLVRRDACLKLKLIMNQASSEVSSGGLSPETIHVWNSVKLVFAASYAAVLIILITLCCISRREVSHSEILGASTLH